jgi:hypothetical protein
MHWIPVASPSVEWLRAVAAKGSLLCEIGVYLLIEPGIGDLSHCFVPERLKIGEGQLSRT